MSLSSQCVYPFSSSLILKRNPLAASFQWVVTVFFRLGLLRFAPLARAIGFQDLPYTIGTQTVSNRCTAASTRFSHADAAPVSITATKQTIPNSFKFLPQAQNTISISPLTTHQPLSQQFPFPPASFSPTPSQPPRSASLPKRTLWEE